MSMELASVGGIVCSSENIQMNVIRRGVIMLVGAGPGAVDLLTVAAVRALQKADLVLSDSLVPLEIRDLVKGELVVAESKRRHLEDSDGIEFFKKDVANVVQTHLNEIALKALYNGKLVIRLKQGDPFLFGRGAEEVMFFRKHGFEPKIIPGISSALYAPTVSLSPVTKQNGPKQFLIITAQGKEGRCIPVPEYNESRATIFLMCVRRITSLCLEMLNNGYPKNLPAVIVENASTSSERVFFGTISCISNVAVKFSIKPPSVLIVGAECISQNQEFITSLINKFSNPVA
jgi:uroporphyrin-III C-methyltransferase